MYKKLLVRCGREIPPSCETVFQVFLESCVGRDEISLLSCIISNARLNTNLSTAHMTRVEKSLTLQEVTIHVQPSKQKSAKHITLGHSREILILTPKHGVFLIVLYILLVKLDGWPWMRRKMRCKTACKRLGEPYCTLIDVENVLYYTQCNSLQCVFNITE